MTDTSPPDSPPSSRRQWFRLSLRGLMLLVLLVGGGLGWKLHRVRTERQAAAVIRAAHGGAEYEMQLSNVLHGRPRPIGTPLAQAGPAWLRRWLGDDFFRPIVYANVPDVPSPEVLEAIGQLGGLVVLEIRCVADLPDRAWEPLAGLTRLEVADFQGPGVTDAALAAIGGAGSIRTVSFNENVAVTDAGLAALAQLPALEELHLNSCPNLTDAGVGRMLAASRSRVLDKLTWSSHSAPVGATIRALGEHHPQLKNLSLDGGPTADADLAPLGKLTSLVFLQLDEVPFSDASVISLEPLVNLQAFAGNFGAVSDAGMKSVGQLRSLQNLSLNRLNCGDAGMKSVGQLRSLQSLHLSGSKVGDAGLVPLAGLAQLTRLYLQGSLVTDAGLKTLAGLKNLVWLDLSGSKVGDAGLADLAGLAKLKVLDLTHTRLTDAGVATLAQFPSLFLATLSETQVTDAALDELGQRPGSLRRLELRATRVTPAGVARFQAARPNVTIFYSTPEVKTPQG